MEKSLSKQEYNDEPVFYCKQCLSLKIQTLGDYIDYCEPCGCTDIASTHIDEWKQLYRERYHKDFIEKNGREK